MKTATPQTYSAVGQVISYSYLVTNSGNTTLSGPFTVSDDKATDESCPATASLAPGASITCTASYTITQADLDAGSVTNIASASNGTVTSPTDTETVDADQNPALSITKVATEASYNTVGQIIHYTIVATNDGNTTLAAVTVSDPNVSDLVCDPANGSSLAPGESMDCTATHTVTQADIDAGSYANQACVDDGADGATAACADEDVPADQNPALSIVKTGTFDAGANGYADVGELISYEFLVTNEGNVTLTGITVSDPLPGLSAISCPFTTLAVGADMTCTATYAVTQDDIDAGTVHNLATADSDESEPDDDENTEDLPQAPRLIIIKHVINDNGGTATASDFMLDSGGTNDSPDDFAGAEAPGTLVTLDAGSYSVGEGVPSGYTASFSADCIGSIANGETKTCTVTNEDDAPSLTLVKTVINNNGGTAVAANWTLTAAGYNAASPQTGTYNLSESGPAGYTQTSLTCSNSTGQVTSVTLGLGEDVTCTFVNDDIAPQLIVIKHVIGGTLTAANFTLDSGGVNDSPDNFPGSETGTTVTLNAGNYNGTETNVLGYSVTYSTDCSGSIAVGQTKTCTVTNRFIDFGQIAPTGVTCEQYVNGTAPDFSDFYASQGGVILYTVRSNKINSTNPGVFFYYTGLSQTIAGSGPRTVYINQSDDSSLLGAFSTTKNDVKLWRVTGTTCTQVQLQANQITLLSGPNAGDVRISFTAAAPAGSYYVISVKYDTSAVVGTNLGPINRPTVKYTFTTDVGNDGSIEETDTKGITLAPRP